MHQHIHNNNEVFVYAFIIQSPQEAYSGIVIGITRDCDNVDTQTYYLSVVVRSGFKCASLYKHKLNAVKRINTIEHERFGTATHTAFPPIHTQAVIIVGTVFPCPRQSETRSFVTETVLTTRLWTSCFKATKTHKQWGHQSTQYEKALVALIPHHHPKHKTHDVFKWPKTRITLNAA